MKVRSKKYEESRKAGLKQDVFFVLRTCAFCNYAAFITFPDRRHRVHTLMRLIPPLIIARTVCRLGSNRRGLTLFA
jgi:hypothetical protein